MIFMRGTVPPELGYQPSDFGEIMAKNCVTSRKTVVYMLVQGQTREIFESKRQNGQLPLGSV